MVLAAWLLARPQKSASADVSAASSYVSPSKSSLGCTPSCTGQQSGSSCASRRVSGERPLPAIHRLSRQRGRRGRNRTQRRREGGKEGTAPPQRPPFCAPPPTHPPTHPHTHPHTRTPPHPPTHTHTHTHPHTTLPTRSSKPSNSSSSSAASAASSTMPPSSSSGISLPSDAIQSSISGW